MIMLTRSLFVCTLCCSSGLGFVAPPRSKTESLAGWNGSLLRSSSSSVVAEPGTALVDNESPFTEKQDKGQTSIQNELKPGIKENDLFECDETVEFWQDFQRNGLHSAEENARSIAQVGLRLASMGPNGMDYWLRHAARSGYFSLNAALGVVGSRLEEGIRNQSLPATLIKGPMGALDGKIVSRLLLEAALSYEQDYKRISVNKQYRKPWDMYYNTKQSSPQNVATQTARFLQEAMDTLRRKTRASQEDKQVVLDGEEVSSMYPEYYKTAFHYQTNGWMSQQSADAYETSTETLFVGRQDAMQRTALPEIVELANKKKRDNKPFKVLELACGTGRFMTFVRDSLPLDAEYTAVDLSPYYLKVARDNDDYWRSCRQRVERQEGKGHVQIKPARILQAKAEDLPFADQEFDAVVCVYLFHELPREVRARVAAEAARVTRPGGKVVLSDSVQLGDRPIFDEQLANFSNMNEPYYEDYVQDDVFEHFTSVGLECGRKTVCSTTKTLTFDKPIEN